MIKVSCPKTERKDRNVRPYSDRSIWIHTVRFSKKTKHKTGVTFVLSSPSLYLADTFSSCLTVTSLLPPFMDVVHVNNFPPFDY